MERGHHDAASSSSATGCTRLFFKDESNGGFRRKRDLPPETVSAETHSVPRVKEGGAIIKFTTSLNARTDSLTLSFLVLL